MSYQTASDLSVRNIGTEVFVLKRSTSTIHSFNATGAFIWDLLQNRLQQSEIAARLTTRFAVPMDTAENDVSEFIDSLIKQQLIEFVD
jgi:hypothetical protein